MLGVGAVVAIPWWAPALLSHSRYFAVRHVQVIGARYFAPEELARGLKLPAGASVWSRLGPLETTLRNTPGVAEAEVSRRLPGTLVIAVRERVPVALADGPTGLVAVDEEARPLPYDVTRPAVDAPVVRRPDTALVRALAVIGQIDPVLFADVAAADLDGGLVLELRQGEGRIRLLAPVNAEQVRAVSAVRRELAGRNAPWRELDGRFRALVVVRGGAS